ncbi:hypothetical protein KR054_004945 [Drosophila jambulina]|nr:hypothetical protein KR054_004945 [Drosophila jambulina]
MLQFLTLSRSITMGDICMKAPSWPDASPAFVASDFAQRMLQQCRQLEKSKGSADLEEFQAKSEAFPAQVSLLFTGDQELKSSYISLLCVLQFGTNTCRVKSQPADRRNKIRDQIASAYPVIHERTLLLYINFLEHKQKFGDEQEKRIYKDMSLVDFVQRLLAKRCVWFFGASDYYKTMEGKTGHEGFEAVGTAAEQYPLELASVLSYDEIKLAALLYVSTHSEFINDGRRANGGEVAQDKSRIEREGVIIGLIGARFERPNVMEYQDIMITRTQNTQAKGYGGGSNSSSQPEADLRRVWREFYAEPQDFLYEKLPSNSSRFEKVSEDYFDQQVMRKRYAITFDTLLLEAQARAVAAGKPAYIHVVGIGLGVWKVSERQERTFFEAFDDRLLALGEQLTHIGVVHFSWFHLPRVGRLYDGALLSIKNHPQGGIQIRNSARNPADKLAEDMLPVVTYAWDGNALPGNEFWAKMLVSTGDPAAACSTLISELQNPHINVQFMSGANLHITSLEHGLLHLGDYARRLKA